MTMTTATRNVDGARWCAWAERVLGAPQGCTSDELRAKLEARLASIVTVEFRFPQAMTTGATQHEASERAKVTARERRMINKADVVTGMVVRETLPTWHGHHRGGYVLVYKPGYAHYVRGNAHGDGAWHEGLRDDMVAYWPIRILYADVRDEVELVAEGVDVSGGLAARVSKAKAAILAAGIEDP